MLFLFYFYEKKSETLIKIIGFLAITLPFLMQLAPA